MGLWTNELKSSHLISASLHAAMLASAKFNDGTTFPYGFGVVLDDYRGEPLLWGHLQRRILSAAGRLS